jgi:hypothetical protein
MQQLRTFVLSREIDGKKRVFDINEKDMDDYICYDVFSDGVYLISISPDGEVFYRSRTDFLSNEDEKKMIDEIKLSI